MSVKRKVTVFALVVIVVAGVARVIVLQQFYQPEKTIAGAISLIDESVRTLQ